MIFSDKSKQECPSCQTSPPTPSSMLQTKNMADLNFSILYEYLGCWHWHLVCPLLPQHDKGVCAFSPNPLLFFCHQAEISLQQRTQQLCFYLCLKYKVTISYQNVKCISIFLFFLMLRDKSLLGGLRLGCRGCATDSISMTTNTLKHNNPMLPVTVPFQGLKWPRHYLQITALCKAAPSRVICQWPQGTGKTEGNRHKQASEKCNGFAKDLASGVTVEEYHSCIRRIRSSGELVNIKGLCKSLPCEDSWQEICLWPSKKEEEFMKSLLLYLRQSLP